MELILHRYSTPYIHSQGEKGSVSQHLQNQRSEPYILLVDSFSNSLWLLSCDWNFLGYNILNGDFVGNYKSAITTLAHKRIRQGMCFVNVIWYLHVAFKFLLVLMHHRDPCIVSELFLLLILILLTARILEVGGKVRLSYVL